MNRCSAVRKATQKHLIDTGWEKSGEGKFTRCELGLRINFAIYRDRHAPETLVSLQVWFPREAGISVSGFDFWFSDWCGAVGKAWASEAIRYDEADVSDEQLALAIRVLLDEWLGPFVASVAAVDLLEQWMLGAPDLDVRSILTRRQPDLFAILLRWQERLA